MSGHPDEGRRRRAKLIFRTATPVGAVLLVLGQVGARTGIVAMPGDPHHILTQVLGAGLLMWGLTRWQ